jgi:protein-disulfide isomerase
MKRYAAPLIIGILVIAIVAVVVFLKSREDNPQSVNVSEQAVSPTPTTVVTIEEFGDYQCEPCAQLHPVLKEIKQQFGPSLILIFRNLPLTTIHKNAFAAAEAAEAARMQNRFWEMHDLLYQNQALWKNEKRPRAMFLKFAGDLGLDTARFERDMDNEQVRFRIEADRDAALRQDIDATPTLLINGRKLRAEATNAEGIRRGIEVVMAGRQRQTTAPSPVSR